MTNEYDFVSAVYGDSQDPMFLNNTDILQSAAGGDFASNVTINPTLVGAFPALPYDSWFTIGAEVHLKWMVKQRKPRLDPVQN